MPWIAVDCHLPDHPKMTDLPSDAARWGWVVVLMKAKTQKRHRFASRRHFMAIMREYGRYLDDYLKAGLLVERDGAIAIARKRNGRPERREAARRSMLMTVRIRSDLCGVCGGALTTAPFPDPWSTTTGHEPPLSRAAEDGWLIVAQRPEHWACNKGKASRYDTEVVRG